MKTYQILNQESGFGENDPMEPRDWLAMLLAMLLGVIVLGLSFVGGYHFGMWFLNKFF